MKKISLAFVVALIAYVASCSLPDPGCDDHSCDEKCEPTIKKHLKSIEMHVAVDCDYDSLCMARYIVFSFAKVKSLDSAEVYENPSTRPKVCYDGFEYVFVNDSIKKKVSSGESLHKIPLKEDHLRFSLFDEDDVEKKYDIDLSEIVHSYKYVGDSLEITVPDYVDTLKIYNDDGERSVYLTPDSLENGKYVFYPDSMYKDVLSYNYTIKVETPLGQDIFEILAAVYYR